MTQNTMSTYEKLYLHRGKVESDDVYVEFTFQQHHLDGIRFLYKQFKSGNPGVILNNLLGSENSLQITLFLGAIKHKLEKPTLILCGDGEENTWLEMFQKVLDANNVIVNAPDAFVRKSFFINNVDGVAELTRHAWGVVVVDNDALLKMKTVLNKLEADYKIWITPIDMKENLQTFSLIYKWIYPKEKFNIEDFKGKPGNCVDLISKSIQLAAFFKDIVLQTNRATPFEDSYGNKFETRKTSRKNKDATGTKIKRTKRNIGETELEKVTIDDVDASAVKIPRVCIGASSIDSSNISEHFNSSKNNNCESDVINTGTKKYDLDREIFKSSKEPFKDLTKPEFDDISNDSQENEARSRVINERDEPYHVSANSSKKCYNLSTKDKFSTQSDAIVSPVSDDDNAYELDTQLNDNNVEIINRKYLEQNGVAESYSHLEEPCVINKMDTSESKQGVPSDNIEMIIPTHDSHMDADRKSEVLDQSNEENNVAGIQKNNKRDNSIVNGESQSNTKNKNKTLDIDSKITEYEDRIFKKFKGTFLDSIF